MNTTTAPATAALATLWSIIVARLNGGTVTVDAVGDAFLVMIKDQTGITDAQKDAYLSIINTIKNGEVTTAALKVPAIEVAPVWTHAHIGKEYSLTVRGWLVDWGIKDMVLTSVMAKEGK